MRKTVIFCLLSVALASAQPKQRIAVLPSVGDLEPQGLILLTDRVREIATKNLPMEHFNILKQDVITKMIGEEELYKACKDGVCIGDLAKKTNANYGARCDVVKFNNSLVLKFELYSVNEDAIFETFTDYSVKDFYGMLDVLEKRLPGAFQKMIAARNAEIAQPKPAAPEPPPAAVVQPKPTAPEPPPVAVVQPKPSVPEPPPAAVVQPKPTVPEPPPAAVVQPTPTAPEPPPAAVVQPTPQARPQPRENPPYAARPAAPRKKASPTVVTLRVTGAAAGGIGLIGGLIANAAAQSALDKYSNFGSQNSPKGTDAESYSKVQEMRKDIDGSIALRNTLYVLGVVGLSGFAITFFF